MSVTQIANGDSAIFPPGPLKISLNGGGGMHIVMRTANNVVVRLPQPRPTELIFVPGAATVGQSLEVVVMLSGGGSFLPGTTVGLTVAPMQAPQDAVVRAPADVGGRTEVKLVSLLSSERDTTVRDLFQSPSPLPPDPGGGIGSSLPSVAISELAQRSWHAKGGYAYHAHHAGPAVRATSWGLVLEASASMLLLERRAELGQLIEILFGLTHAAQGRGPVSVSRTTASGSSDLMSAIDRELVDWGSAFGTLPSPWSRVMPAVLETARRTGDGGVIVLITDGVPVDYEELLDWASASSHRLHMITFGRSVHDYRPELRVQDWWLEELAAVSALATDGHSRLVAISDPANVVTTAVDLATALYPVARR